MNPLCCVCNSSSHFLLEKDNFDLYRCPKCKLVFVFPQPTPEFLQKELYSYESGYQANRAEDLSKIPQFPRMKKILDAFIKLTPNGRILDVGSAGGQFMYWARKRGFKPVGVELNKRTADSAVAQGFEVFNGFLEKATFEPHSFDAVFLGEIIEHVPDPRSLIRSCKKFLKPGGYIAITTPNLDCFWSQSTFVLWRLFKVPWSSVTPPYHLCQFSIKNLDLLLANEGFSLAWKDFLLMSRLKYELGMLHLLKRFKKTRRVGDLIFMLFSFSVYTILYVLNVILHPFLRKDFNMMRVYKVI